MTDVLVKYDASPTTIACTLTSMADTNLRKSANVDNSSNRYVDAHVTVQVQARTATAGGYVALWALGGFSSVGQDTPYSALQGEEVLLYTLDLDATTETRTTPPISVASGFGGVLPKHWCLIVENQSNDQLGTTAGSHHIEYVGIKYSDT